MAKKCFETPMTFWVIHNNRTHVKVGEGLCIEVQPDLYAENEFGKIPITADLPKEVLWDMSVLSKEDIELAKQLYKEHDKKGLLLLHNKYKLAGFTICCDTISVYLTFGFCIKKGII